MFFFGFLFGIRETVFVWDPQVLGGDFKIQNKFFVFLSFFGSRGFAWEGYDAGT